MCPRPTILPLISSTAPTGILCLGFGFAASLMPPASDSAVDHELSGGPQFDICASYHTTLVGVKPKCSFAFLGLFVPSWLAQVAKTLVKSPPLWKIPNAAHKPLFANVSTHVITSQCIAIEPAIHGPLADEASTLVLGFVDLTDDLRVNRFSRDRPARAVLFGAGFLFGFQPSKNAELAPGSDAHHIRHLAEEHGAGLSGRLHVAADGPGPESTPLMGKRFELEAHFDGHI